jgi:nucleoside-diphosphate-sugar epimerase
MNRMLVTVKVNETVSMIKNNVAIPFIEVEDCKDENIHAFEIVNTDWVPENTVLRRPRISEVARMLAKCFLERGIPFQYNPITRIPETVNLMKYADQRFELGYKPKKEDHQWATGKRRERRMARIEGREPEEEELEILHLGGG